MLDRFPYELYCNRYDSWCEDVVINTCGSNDCDGFCKVCEFCDKNIEKKKVE